jgi:hypothetical protein
VRVENFLDIRFELCLLTKYSQSTFGSTRSVGFTALLPTFIWVLIVIKFATAIYRCVVCVYTVPCWRLLVLHDVQFSLIVDSAIVYMSYACLLS